MALPQLTVLVGSVLPQPSLSKPEYKSQYRAGAVMASGDVVYLDTTAQTPVWQPAIATGTASVYGVVAAGAMAIGQYVVVQTNGHISLNTGGSSLAVVGRLYTTSSVSKKIDQVPTSAVAANTDTLASGSYLTVIGWCTAADILYLQPTSTGVQHA